MKLPMTARDEAYWRWQEENIVRHLVSIGDYGFVVDHDCFQKGWTNDPRCLVRPAVAEALVEARKLLPNGYTFKIYDGYRSAEEQDLASKETEEELRVLYPEWGEEEMRAGLQKFCPPPSLGRDFGEHSYGGALDLTIVTPDGEELDMGSMVNDVGPAASLYYFETLKHLSPAQRVARTNRRLLIVSLGSVDFSPLMAEWWHWGYREDV